MQIIPVRWLTHVKSYNQTVRRIVANCKLHRLGLQNKRKSHCSLLFCSVCHFPNVLNEKALQNKKRQKR